MVNITSRNELGDNVDLRLAVELMGRSSNLVLIGSDGRIIDCLRRMDYGGDAERRLLPGMMYRLPPKQRKPLIFDLPQEEIAQTLAQSDAGKSTDKRIMDSFSGLSPLVCRELACRSGDHAAFLPEPIGAFLESVPGRGAYADLAHRGRKAEGVFASCRTQAVCRSTTIRESLKASRSFLTHTAQSAISSSAAADELKGAQPPRQNRARPHRCPKAGSAENRASKMLRA